MRGSGDSRRRGASLSVVVLAMAVGAVCVAWAVAATRGGWLGQALRNRLTLTAGGILLGSVVALYLVVGIMWRLGSARRTRRATGQEGTAAIEFMLLFPIALAIVLVMIQSSLLVSHNIVAHYAAYIAVRSAIVWVPEEVSYDEPRNQVTGPDYSIKMEHIRKAAALALCPAAPGKAGAGGAAPAAGSDLYQEAYQRLYSLYGQPPPAWIARRYGNMYQYAFKYTDVELAPPQAGAVYGDHEDLTVTVRHTLFLSVPYANRLFALGSSGRALPGGDYGTAVEIKYSLTNQGVQDVIDVEVFPRYVGRGQQ